EAPGRVQWEICGTGPDLKEITQLKDEMGLNNVVFLHGWTSLKDLHDVYARSHMSIVPTRSSFTEALPMTAAEAVLAGRPLITSSVVPALEILRPACVEAKPDNVDSYVKGILGLIDDPNLYRTLCKACPALQQQFYDREQGLRAVLKKILSPN